MAHEYKKEADASHERKLKSYGKDEKALGSKEKAKNWAGFDALNTNEQAGLRPLNKEPSLSKDTADRIMRKKGGRVHGAQSLKRLDKAPRKGKAAGGQMMGTGQRIGAIPSPQTEQEDFDPQLRGVPGQKAPGTTRKKGGKVMRGQQDYESRSHESQGSQGLRPREGHRKGGSAYHEGHMNRGEKYGAARTSGETKGELDSAMRALKYGNKAKAEKELGRAQGHTRKTEYYTGRAAGGKAFEGSAKDEREDKKLEKKYGMTHKEWEASDLDKKHDKQESMEGLKKGGRAKRASGGGAFADYEGGESSAPKSGGKSGKGKTTVNIMIGSQPQEQGPNPMQAAALAAMLGGPKGGPGAPPPPAPPPGAMPPPGMAAPAPAMMPPPAAMPPQGPPPGGPPMPRARGGRTFADIKVSKPKIKDGYPALTGGSGGGKGRREKILAYGDEQK